METVRKLHHQGKEILVIDYSDQRGHQLIETFERAKSLALTENKQVVVLSIFNHKTFVNSHFMQHLRHHLPKVDRIIRKQAVVGLSITQEWILKGLNLWYERNVYSFASVDEALHFLVTDDHDPKSRTN